MLLARGSSDAFGPKADMNKESQRAAVYERAGIVLAYAEHRTVDGFFIASEPYMSVPELAATQLGKAILEALKRSKAGVAVPAANEWPRLSGARLKAAGVTSEASFMRGARLVSVEAVEDAIQLVPHRNGGATGKERGFHPLTQSAASLVVGCSETTLGSLCLQALNQCQ
jgi:hypothetical protein